MLGLSIDKALLLMHTANCHIRQSCVKHILKVFKYKTQNNPIVGLNYFVF